MDDQSMKEALQVSEWLKDLDFRKTERTVLDLNYIP